MNNLGPLVDTFSGLAPWRGDCAEGSFANFLGVMTDLEFVERHHPSNVQLDCDDASTGLRLPTVADGETFFEFAAIHEAVRAARDRFVMIELGGGYAARSVDAHQLLQSLNPMPSQLVIVEAEPTHFQWAKRHLAANGIDPKDHWLINAAVSVDTDPILFMQGAGVYFNGNVTPENLDVIIERIIDMGASEKVLKNLLMGGRCGMKIPYNSDAGEDLFDYAYVSAMPLNDILGPLTHVDLMDIDIQGAEDSVIEPAIEMLNARVKRLHIGTHGADIHAGLWDLFFENEWACEFDYPPFQENETPWGSFKTVDGILHLSNMRLTGDGG
ncbi:MAG: hypothetical protein HN478_00010 [Rhodospirillaceae bacterium]|jgi:hypothetical protein|nr:hypothetical protein [Rhodospirillaceae bacterium]MBT4486823.1 hypothetical protein [Rhodospirillaceae bacterium]MBT5193757.1 hypothetical protein [Rhodospirillaceae bacterium]MBT5895297.1 hypothetical protein [Rhodospirillaceae bacterium]MBT6428216.1 hypothetical protein [Rhodospirillaceae bacterium]